MILHGVLERDHLLKSEGIDAKSFLACAPLKFKIKFTSDFSEGKFRQ